MTAIGTVLSLCDYTGNFVKPWVEAGYDAVLVDPQHGVLSSRDGVVRLPMTVEESMRAGSITNLLRSEAHIVFFAAFPPCTDMAVSGARWFESKREADPMFQAKAVALAEQCRTIGMLSGAL